MKSLITGVSGHVGANLVRALLKRKRKVRVLIHRDDSAIRGLDVEIVRGDILDPESLAKAVKGCGTVFHCAGKISLSGDRDGSVHRINVIGTRNVVDACIAAGVKRLVHFSSIYAYSRRPLYRIITEESPLSMGKEEYAYNRSKAEGVIEIRKGVERGLDAVMLHPTGIIGPHDYRSSQMGSAMRRLYYHELPSIIDNGFDWVDVRDVADAALAAEKLGRRGESYIVSNRWASTVELAVMIRELAGGCIPTLISPLWIARATAPFVELYGRVFSQEPLYSREAIAALTGHRFISNEKAVRDLGFRPRPIIETVRDTFAWFHEQGLLDRPVPERAPLSARLLGLFVRWLPLGFTQIKTGSALRP